VKAHIERRYGVPFEHPGSRLREYVLALRAIFASFQTGAPLDFDGDRWRLDLLPRTWSPGPIENPEVPIYVAAVVAEPGRRPREAPPSSRQSAT